MYCDKRVVCVTPAGRRRYLEILQYYVFRAIDAGIVDEWNLWINTNNADDLACVLQLARQRSEVTLTVIQSPLPFSSARISPFYEYAAKPDTLYIRFDDDVVWVAPDAIQELLSFKVSHPEVFVALGNVVNNPISTFRQHQVGALNDLEIEDFFAHHQGIGCVVYHAALHRQFLAQPDKTRFHFPDEILPLGKRAGVHFTCWEGSRFAAFGGKLPQTEHPSCAFPLCDEEPWLTSIAPLEFNEPVGLCGTALAVHYAYTSQRSLEGPNLYAAADPNPEILAEYRKLIS